MKKIKEPIVEQLPLTETISKEKHHKEILDVLNSLLKKLEKIETNTFKGF